MSVQKYHHNPDGKTCSLPLPPASTISWFHIINPRGNHTIRPCHWYSMTGFFPQERNTSSLFEKHTWETHPYFNGQDLRDLHLPFCTRKTTNSTFSFMNSIYSMNGRALKAEGLSLKTLNGRAVNLVARYRRGICVPWGAFLEWRTAQQIGRCLESTVRSPCKFSGSVLPSAYLIACLIPTVRLYVVCWRQICILLLLIVLAGLLKSRMRSMDCKVVQECSNRKCWEPHRFPCKSSFTICVSDIWRYGGKLIFHVLAQ